MRQVDILRFVDRAQVGCCAFVTGLRSNNYFDMRLPLAHQDTLPPNFRVRP